MISLHGILSFPIYQIEHQAKINVTVTETQIISSVVPQGTALGPLLFIM